MSRVFLAAFCVVACWPLPARCALDPEADKPYDLQVVLHIADHRLFTPVFKEQVRRELHDILQAALGDMGQVEVVDQHPLLKQIEAKGLQQGLDGNPDWKEVSERKTHFVLLDFVNGRYEIQARQHDGLTGLNSPVVRRAELNDPAGRQLVARTAALLIGRDFGLVGTLEAGAQPPEVAVTFKAGNLGSALQRWVKPGDVFALTMVIERGDHLQSYPVEWALLQATDEPNGGVCHCRVFNRFRDPLKAAPGVVGYRCLKLGTGRAPLRFQLVDERTRRPIASQPVRVTADDFASKTAEAHSSNYDGIMQTKKAYDHIAFVRVLNQGGGTLAQVPVAILDDRTVVCPMTITAQAQDLGDLQLQKQLLMGQINDSLAVANQLFKELSQLLSAKKHEAALDKARAAKKELENDVARYDSDLAALLTRAAERHFESQLKLTQEEQLVLKALKARPEELQDIIVKLQNVIAEKNDPRRAELLAMVEQARLLEKQADYEQAIRLYETVLKELKEGGDKPKLQAHLEKLKEEWRIKSPEHRQARTFIYQTWPKLESAQELLDNLDKARSALKTCKEADDRLTLRKLLLIGPSQKDILQKELEGLRSQTGEDANKKRKTIAEVGEGLGKLYKEAAETLQAGQQAAK